MTDFQKRSPARVGARNRAQRSSFAGSTNGTNRRWCAIDFSAVIRAALACLPAVLARLIQGGMIIAGEFVALNPTRSDNRPGSFKVNLRTGRWADIATGDKGGDPVSLVAFVDDLPHEAEAAS